MRSAMLQINEYDDDDDDYDDENTAEWRRTCVTGLATQLIEC